MALPRWLVLEQQETKRQKSSPPKIADDAKLRILDVDGKQAIRAADWEARFEKKPFVISGKLAKKLVKEGEGYIDTETSPMTFRFTKEGDSFLAELQARYARKMAKEGVTGHDQYEQRRRFDGLMTKEQIESEQAKHERSFATAPTQDNYKPASECRLGRDKGWVLLRPLFRAGPNQRKAKNSRMGKNAKAKAQAWKEDYLQDRAESSLAGYRYGGTGQVDVTVCLVRRLDSPADEDKTWNWAVLGRTTEATLLDTRGDITASSYEGRTTSEKIQQRGRAKGSGYAEGGGERRAGHDKRFAVPARIVVCPTCDAQPEEPCVSPATGNRTTTHKKRIEEYIELTKGEEDEVA